MNDIIYSIEVAVESLLDDPATRQHRIGILERDLRNLQDALEEAKVDKDEKETIRLLKRVENLKKNFYH